MAAPEPLVASLGVDTTPTPAPTPAPQPTAPMPQMPVQDMNPYGMPMGAYPGMQQPMMGYPNMPYGMPYGQPMQAPPMQEVNVQPAQFQAFSENLSAVTQKENIDLIMDVPLEVTVELGRTSKSIQDILEFAPGTIIELDKIAGEPIDVLVNGKFVAKGEVVVIEESFGIRVTEIVK
jgi:flagellar motor switch protein FliN/FliY